MMLSPELSKLRSEYSKNELTEPNVSADPIEQFSKWFADALAVDPTNANAMILSTTDASAKPSARVLLLRGADVKGFTFFTNYTSRKAREMDANSRAAMLFFWASLERQVRIEGTVEKTSREESEAYFHSRPRASQISAWASHQSGVIESRDVLEKRWRELELRFADGPVPLPDFWGGYRLVPDSIEFWQGRPSRLHDRLLYTPQADGSWKIERLEP
jgi:pyridoxamine 5'-phosphate oxidase